MGRRALLVGINHYDYMPNLTWCIDDVLSMRQVLAFHANHDPNFDCHVLLSSGPIPEASDASSLSERVTFNRLTFDEDLYFAAIRSHPVE